MTKTTCLLAGFLLLILAPALRADWPVFVLYQKDAIDSVSFGSLVVAGAGDVNGDGKSDFIIGSFGLSAAYVYSGADGSLLYQKNGTSAYDFFGISVASAGDVNGDGRADFIIGAQFAEPGGLYGAGSAYVYSGADGALLYQKNGAAASDYLGRSVASAGDVNGDGRADFIIGATGADPGGVNGAGSAFIYSGLDGALLYQKNGASNSYYLGTSVASAGDVNADGRPDFIIGAAGAGANAGSAYVYSGLNGSLLYQKNGAGNDQLGISVTSAGDLDGDGRADFIIGAFRADPGGLTDAGSAYVYSGADGSLLYQKNGAAANDQLGTSVAPAGDVNGDGRADFIIGAPGADPGGFVDAGSAYLYSGADGSLLSRIYRPDSYVLGESVASAGDVNADGRAEPLVEGRGGGGIIRAYVFSFGYTERILAVGDVPGDQGKQVRIQWKSKPGNDSSVTRFALFRRVDVLARATGPNVFAGPAWPPGRWEQVAVFAAFGDTIYNGVVPTLYDSTVTVGMKYSVFFVRAATNDPLIYFDSPLDSGYSKDNLPPAAVAALTASGSCQGTVNLSYSPPQDEDFQYFKIYRDTSASFSSPKVAGSTIDSFYSDATPLGKIFHYRVCAVDFSGNEGPLSPQASALAAMKGDLNLTDDLSPADAVLELNAVFLGSSIPAPFCAADLNCSGSLTPADVVLELNGVFLGAAFPC